MLKKITIDMTGKPDPTLTSEMIGDAKSVSLTSDVPVILGEDVDMVSVHAPDVDIIATGSVSLNSLTAKSYRGGGNLYPVFGMEIKEDLRLDGELIGERHSPYVIHGNLSCSRVEVDGHVSVGEKIEISEGWSTRSFTVGGVEQEANKEIQDEPTM